MSTDDIKNKLAARSEGGTPGRTVYDLLERQKSAIALALPKTMNAERFARIVLTECKRTPRLLACTPQSLLGAVMLGAQLGLEPGPLGHCYLVPFKNKGVLEVQFIIGYKGLIDLARRSGNIESIVAREVCALDHFEFEYGLDEKLVHRPSLTRSDPIAYYAVARYTGGGHTMLVMSLADIYDRRNRSRAKDAGPWVSDFDAMARKTVIRAMASYLPLSIEAAQAVVADEVVTTDLGPSLVDNFGGPEPDDVIDVPELVDPAGEGAPAIDPGVPPADETADDPAAVVEPDPVPARGPAPTAKTATKRPPKEST